MEQAPTQEHDSLSEREMELVKFLIHYEMLSNFKEAEIRCLRVSHMIREGIPTKTILSMYPLEAARFTKSLPPMRADAPASPVGIN